MTKIMTDPNQAWQVWTLRAISAGLAWFLIHTLEEIKDAVKIAYANRNKIERVEKDLDRVQIVQDKNIIVIQAIYETLAGHTTQIELLKNKRLD